MDEHYGFSFLVPHIMHSAVPLKYGQHMPPSLHVHFSQAGHQHHQGTCTIDYRIRAQFLIDGNCLAEQSRPFRLLTSSERQPPVCTEDFPGEYKLSHYKTLRSPFYQPAGRLLVHSLEPFPLAFSPGGKGATTSVRLRLQYKSLKGDNVIRIPPPRFYGLVRSYLKATTFISTEPQRRSPATCDARTSPFTVKAHRSYASQIRKLSFGSWTPLETATGTIWESETDLLVKCDNAAYLTPSFSSMLVSRRYSLKIHMVVSGNGHAALKLELPIQVLYIGDGYVQTEEAMYWDSSAEHIPPAYST
ncbi:hypothetical protein BBP40_012414 [Aspergillus hancockii]|nr:hypothetical protein BBP40_012414 [Aspergillus hancockii]